MAFTDSRSAGVLSPLKTENGGAIDDALRGWIAGLTGLPITSIRRRWMPRPGTQPGLGVDWCAVGVERVSTHGTPYQRNRKGAVEGDLGDVTRESHQTFKCVASFYGPNAFSYADRAREGAQLGQNLSNLLARGLTLQAVDDDLMHLPDFLCEQWVDRYDLSFSVGRKVSRTYGVRDLAAIGEINIHTD